MRIELSKAQFRTLVELVFLGDWIANAARIPGEDEVRRFSSLKQHIYTLAHQSGLRNFVEYDPRLRRFFPTNTLHDRLEEIIDEYDDETLWQELQFRLAARDLRDVHGDAVDSMSPEERISKEEPLLDRYQTEFEEHGMERLRIVEVQS